MEDGPHVEAGLERSPAHLDTEQLLVAQGEIVGTQGVVVRGDDPLAVVVSGLRDRGAVDVEPAVGVSEVLAEALARQESTPPLCGGLVRLRRQRGELRLELSQEAGTVLALALLLARVVTDDVPPSGYAIADDDLLDAEVVGDGVVAARAGEDVMGDLVTGTHARCQD